MASTTLSSWALLVWQELQERDLGARDIFVAAGLDPVRLQDPNARFPVPGMQRLWQLAEEHSGDPAFGVAAGMRWNPTTFHALGYAWLASATLAQARFDPALGHHSGRSVYLGGIRPHRLVNSNERDASLIH